MNTKKSFAKVGVVCQLFAMSSASDAEIAPLIFGSEQMIVMIEDGKQVRCRIVSEFSDPASEGVVELKKDGLGYVDNKGGKYRSINRHGKEYIEKVEQSQ